MKNHKSDTTKYTAPPNTKDAIAVAIKQPQNQFAPPRVLAGGIGRFAEQLLAVAFQNGIRVRQDTDLAELLGAIRVDSEIPAEAFATVAEILSYLYLLNDELKNSENSSSPSNEPNKDLIRRLAGDLQEKWNEGNLRK